MRSSDWPKVDQCFRTIQGSGELHCFLWIAFASTPGLEFIVHADGAIELTEAGFWPTVQDSFRRARCNGPRSESWSGEWKQ